jgi:transposase
MSEKNMEMFERPDEPETLPKKESGNEKPKIRVVDRKQVLIRCVDVEQSIPEDHPARAIWEFVEQMDLKVFYERIESKEGELGRPAIDPRVLMSLWIYGYSEGVGSARELSEMCEYEPGCLWLTGYQSINYHTIADFRTAGEKILDELFTQTLGILSSQGLITLKRIAQDGTKIRACAGASTLKGEDKLRAHLQEAEKQMTELSYSSEEESSLRRKRAQERAARERKERLQEAIKQLEVVKANKSDQKVRVSETDPDCRKMKQSNGGFALSYNVQVCTDGENDLIVAVAASQSGNDYHELIPAVEEVHQRLGAYPEQVLADAGYNSSENVMAMAEKGIDFVSPLVEEESHQSDLLKRREVDSEFSNEKFVYQKESDTYLCPAGKTLMFKQTREKRPGIFQSFYRADWNDCRSCPLKNRCCPKNRRNGRTIAIKHYSVEMETFRNKMSDPQVQQLYKKRAVLAEFPFAWIKSKIGLVRFHLRGLAKVTMEILWASLTYNIQQWMRLAWNPRLNTG